MYKQEHIDEFRTRGFTAIERFFDETETLAMQVEVEQWITSGLFRDVSTNPKRRQNFQCIPLYPHSPLFRALPHSQKVVDVAEALLGPPVAKILDQSFYKPPRSGMGTNWHTDNAYFRLADPLKGMAMWIAIQESNAENGGLKIVPDVFNEEFPHERDPRSDHHIRTHLDEGLSHQFELAAGSVVFFCFGTPHATGDNRSAIGRTGVGIHFVSTPHADELSGRRWQQVALSGEKSERMRHDFPIEVNRLVLSHAENS